MPLRADLLQPIPGDSPGGVSLRYDPIYDKIKEARREDVDLPLGDWQRTLKVADHGLVIKLTGEALATKSKDLQIAVWLTEAHVRRDGFGILPECFKFLHDLTDQFWDSLFPEIEDGDVEMRATPLEWIGGQFDPCLRGLPLTSTKLSWFKYKESRAVGYESDASTDSKMNTRNALIADGRLTAEAFDQSVDETPLSFYQNLQNALAASIEQLGSLADLCDSKFGSYSPSFIKTRDTLEEIAQTVRIIITKKGGNIPVEEPLQDELSEPVESAPQYEQPVTSSTGSAAAVKRAPQPVAVGLEPADLPDAARRLAAVARFMRQQDQYNIASYLILRGFRWGELRYNGPNIDPNMLEAPASELRSALKRYALEQDWDKVLETTETAMEQPCGRGWLDIQRYAVRALENKGEYFAFVAQAIRGALRMLLQDLPGLLDLTLLDDTPTANPETLAWIRQDILQPTNHSTASIAAEEPAAEPEPVPEPKVLYEAASFEDQVPSMEQDLVATEEVFDAALSKARSGYIHDAIEIISNELATERTGRGRFKRRMQLAHLLMASGRNRIAYPILKQLAAEIDDRRLDEWESGEVLAYPLDLLLECATGDNGDPQFRETLYSRICQLDPLRGLKRGD
jgi:type VI secretion system protein ImpA